MLPDALIASLAAHGMVAELTDDGESICIRPARLLTDADREFIRANKLAIVAALKGDAGAIEQRDAEQAPNTTVTATKPRLIDMLADAGLLHPAGTITTFADGRRVWRHPDDDGCPP